MIVSDHIRVGACFAILQQHAPVLGGLLQLGSPREYA
jgi:hypothetical protein